MEGPCSIAPVTSLSESSDTDAEWLQRQANSKRKGPSCPPIQKRQPVSDTVQIQIMLSKNSAKCKAGCRDKFRSKTALQELIAFRKEWADLHKTDQDNLVPQFNTAYCSFESMKYRIKCGCPTVSMILFLDAEKSTWWGYALQLRCLKDSARFWKMRMENLATAALGHF